MIAFIGSKRAVIAGDKREIAFQGDPSATERLETELYSGQIVTDATLLRRAKELGILLRIRDTKDKIQERNGILIGEVSDFEGGILRKRRLYATMGKFALAELEGSHMEVIQEGEGSKFIFLGNDITKKIAYDLIQKEWKNGSLSDAVLVIRNIMEAAARKTASVSKTYEIRETHSRGDIRKLIEIDHDSGR